jgi:carbon storage regulator
MLVLSRGKDESIMVGENVEVTVVDIRGNNIRLGITAPKSIPVHRREVYDAIHAKKPQTKKTNNPHPMQKDKL